MIAYPEQLIPQTTESLTLPSGVNVEVPKTLPAFKLWEGEFEGDTYGNKPLLDSNGTPMFAELAILKLFLEESWDGVWVDTFSRKYRITWGDEGVVKLSGDRLELLKAVHRRAGSASGCFDVFCWKDEAVVFAESKRRSKDTIRPTQLAWLEAALQTGLVPDSFLIVEWSATNARISKTIERPNTFRPSRLPFRPDGESRSAGVSEPPPASEMSGDPVIFFDAYDAEAHTKFLAWVERNQRGYVISRRSPGNAMVHQAYCGHFKHGDKTASLTRIMKICSTSRRELDVWVRDNLSLKAKSCRSCM